MKTVLLSILIQFIGSIAWSANVQNPCESNEKWDFSDVRKGGWITRYQRFILDRESPWISFGDAVQLRKNSRIMKQGTFESEFSEYWVGQILLRIGFHSLAQEYFLSSRQNATTPSVRNASSSCLEITRIRSRMNLSPSDLHHLIAGRELYEKKKYSESIQEFLKVDKRSSLKIDSLNDLSWAYLLSGKHQETIGLALQLRSGIFKNTFSPESMMTAIMALNEICSYPDASRMIQLFLTDYGSTHEWLEKNTKHSNPYQEISLALKNQSTVPAKIRTEWIRHPEFLSRQQEINQLIELQRKIETIPSKIDSTLSSLRKKLVARINRILRKPDTNEFREVRKELRQLVRYQKSSKILIQTVKKEGQRIPEKKATLVSDINRKLIEKNSELRKTLKKVRENIDLVEVEIYQGASKDLLGLKKPKSRMNHENQENQPVLAWNWGSFNASELERAEIWEDEIGALKADTRNRCLHAEEN